MEHADGTGVADGACIHVKEVETYGEMITGKSKFKRVTCHGQNGLKRRTSDRFSGVKVSQDDCAPNAFFQGRARFSTEPSLLG